MRIMLEGVVVGGDLIEVAEFGGKNIHAVQLDMSWPDVSMITKLKKSRSDIDVILQIGREAFCQIDNDPKKLVEKLREYEGIVSSILLDKSMGAGRSLNPQEMIRFIEVIAASDCNFGIAIAGGLGPNSLGSLDTILESFSEISIDAQGKLRTSGKLPDPINWGIAEKYLQEALKKFNGFC